MEVGDFRSKMLASVRAFDAFAWKDALTNPEDYAGYEFANWFEMFKDFVENQNVS
jgi:hypothetical protein